MVHKRPPPLWKLNVTKALFNTKQRCFSRLKSLNTLYSETFIYQIDLLLTEMMTNRLCICGYVVNSLIVNLSVVSIGQNMDPRVCVYINLVSLGLMDPRNCCPVGLWIEGSVV